MARKTRFGEDVVSGFLSTPVETEKQEGLNFHKDTIPPGWKINHEIVESKSKRVQLLMQPTLHSKIKKSAQKKGLSVNDYIHRVLLAHIEEMEKK